MRPRSWGRRWGIWSGASHLLCWFHPVFSSCPGLGGWPLTHQRLLVEFGPEGRRKVTRELVLWGPSCGRLQWRCFLLRAACPPQDTLPAPPSPLLPWVSPQCCSSWRLDQPGWLPKPCPFASFPQSPRVSIYLGCVLGDALTQLSPKRFSPFFLVGENRTYFFMD